MKEKWVNLPEYPGYAVSNLGEVMSVNRNLILKQQPNQQGIPSVHLMLDGQQVVRGVAQLVARMFHKPMRYDFNSVINLDGNRLNCRSDNLAWRPRWFAIEYHRQFRPDYPKAWMADRNQYRDIASRIEYENGWIPATRFGLLVGHLFVATSNNTHVFPTGQRFEFIE